MTSLSSETIHSSTVAIDGMAVLIAGPSGAGKSDLALRLIDRGAVLVSDDQTMLTRRGQDLVATAPHTIQGKIEIRGIGVVDCPTLPEAPLKLIVRLNDQYERFPLERQSEIIAGVSIASVALNPWEASAPIKVEWALRLLGDQATDRASYKPAASL